MTFKINGTLFKAPHHFNIQRYNLTKAGRVATGQMVMDFIAKKRRFDFTYDVISGNDLDHLLDLLDTTEMFMTFSYEQNDIEYTATVYVGAIPTDRFRTDTGAWYWRNVSFALIER